MRTVILTLAACALLGAGCPEQVQNDVTAFGESTRENVEQLNDKAEKTKKVSEDIQTLSRDLQLLLESSKEAQASTDAPPSEDPPQP